MSSDLARITAQKAARIMSSRQQYGAEMTESTSVIRLPPYTYIHVQDNNTNVTRVVSGPLTFTRQEHERVVRGVTNMIMLPAMTYVVIGDPALRNVGGDIVTDKFGQIKLKHGDFEVRLADKFPEPFPLFPGEYQSSKEIEHLKIVEANTALHIKAKRDFVDDDNEIERAAGDEWLFKGPGTYIPRVEEEIVELVKAIIIEQGQALQLRARRQCRDGSNHSRKSGEEWLIREAGAYLPTVDEEIVAKLEAIILTDKTALHLRAKRTFEDVYGKKRRAGEEWLVTHELAETHVLDVHEEVAGDGVVTITTLTNRQYCVVLDPYVEETQRLGCKQLRKGETSFFLKPGERLLNGIEDFLILADDEAVLLQATEGFVDKTPFGEGGSDVSDEGGEAQPVQRKPGDRWMVYGPCEYVPPVEVKVIETRKAIPLDENEGVYVRDIKTGQVRAVIGKTYMLQPTEELWPKELPPEVEQLLTQQMTSGTAYVDPGSQDRAPKNSTQRDRTRVVSFRVPHNAAIQVYDYKRKQSRISFGPALVLLGPDEQFTILRLSGDKPKRPKVIQTLCLQLGPDFMTDIVNVETSDHARLQLTLAYNWQFDVDRTSEDSAAIIFNVRDFVGDVCKSLASRVRGAVASETFDNFHKRSASIIRGAIFGYGDEGGIRDRLVFPNNNLVITNVDIQAVDPVDNKTRESLQKSVQLAIEITTKSQEARAQAEAQREQEEALGALQRQKIKNERDAEASKKELLTLQSETAAVKASGEALAMAKAKAEACEIEGKATLRMTEMKIQAQKIESNHNLLVQQAQTEADLDARRKQNEVEIEREKQLAEIEVRKFTAMIEAIGRDTLAEMARAGPEMQAKLLQGLGLQGYLVTDGKSPINLFQTASGLIGAPNAGASS